MGRRCDERNKQIVALYFEGKTVSELAQMYGLSEGRISFIIRKSPEGKSDYLQKLKEKEASAKERGRLKRQLQAEREAVRNAKIEARERRIIEWLAEGREFQWMSKQLGLSCSYTRALVKRTLKRMEKARAKFI